MKSTAKSEALVSSLELPRLRKGGRMDTTESWRRSARAEKIPTSGSDSLADWDSSRKTAEEAEEWSNGGAAGRAGEL
jgi:hypothetical protein